MELLLLHNDGVLSLTTLSTRLSPIGCAQHMLHLTSCQVLLGGMQGRTVAVDSCLHSLKHALAGLGFEPQRLHGGFWVSRGFKWELTSEEVCGPTYLAGLVSTHR